MEAEKDIPISTQAHWITQIPSRLIPPLILAPFIIAAFVFNYEELDFWFFIKMLVATVVLLKVLKWLNIDGKGPGCGTNQSCNH